jgi:Uma2 family endonuclease
MTVDEYFRTPETLRPAELAYGILRVADAPTPRHQQAVAQLFVALRTHVLERGLGHVWLSPLDVVLDARRSLIVQPDLMFIAHNREWIIRDRVRGAPNLVVEVLSPNPRIGNTNEHLEWFAKYGVGECWLVHEDQKRLVVVTFAGGRVHERRLMGLKDPIVSTVLPDFSLSLDTILHAR